ERLHGGCGYRPLGAGHPHARQQLAAVELLDGARTLQDLGGALLHVFVGREAGAADVAFASPTNSAAAPTRARVDHPVLGGIALGTPHGSALRSRGAPQRRPRHYPISSSLSRAIKAIADSGYVLMIRWRISRAWSRSPASICSTAIRYSASATFGELGNSSWISANARIASSGRSCWARMSARKKCASGALGSFG